MPPDASPAPAPPAPSGARSSRRAHLAFAGLLLLFTAWAYAQGGALDPTARDQSADMTLGLRIHKGGDMTDGNRHPLFPAILSLWASRGANYVVDARLVAVFLAALALLAAYLAASRTFSAALALGAAALYALELRFQARRICPEPLVALFLVTATAFLARAPSARRPWAAALAGGAGLGLAWLSKGTALLSFGAAVVWLVVAMRRRSLAPVLATVAGFALAAWPLLAWNVEHHGSPFWNANSAHVMWEDAWDQDLDKTSAATAATWFERHGVGDAVARLGHGLVHQGGVEWVYAFLGLVVAARLLRRPAPSSDSPRAAWRGLAVVTSLAWLLPLAWYEPIVDSRRLLFPIFAVIAPPALDALASLAPTGFASSRAGRALAGSGRVAALPWAGACLVASIALVVAHGNPLTERHLDDATVALAARLNQPPYVGTTILAKPSRTVPPDWMVDGKATFLAIPKAVADADAPAWIAERAQYVLVSSGLVANRRSLVEPLATWDPVEGLVGKPLPPWLVVDWVDPSTPSRYRLLRVVKSPGG